MTTDPCENCIHYSCETCMCLEIRHKKVYSKRFLYVHILFSNPLSSMPSGSQQAAGLQQAANARRLAGEPALPSQATAMQIGQYIRQAGTVDGYGNYGSSTIRMASRHLLSCIGDGTVRSWNAGIVQITR